MRAQNFLWLAAALAAVSCYEGGVAVQQQAQGVALSGAIFTTTADGSRVNANIYEAKEDVYLDGGPGQRAPSQAAALPEGDYFFQVTDPSGKDLLSTDHISCRRVHINESGVIDLIYESFNYLWVRGAWQPVACQHVEGTELDHPALDAITVQLFPYDNTPNNGGVYKVWLTRVEDYAGDPELIPVDRKDLVNGELYAAGYYHGFIPARSKTDNFKVRGKCDPGLLGLRKFHDRNLDGVWGLGEEEVHGWAVEVRDPLGASNTYHTPEVVLASQGLWTAIEELPARVRQTSAYLDNVLVSLFPAANPTVEVVFVNQCAERHDVLYGNIGVGWIEGCKVYDRNANGLRDPDEPLIAGWPMSLRGTDITGAAFGPVTALTEENGCVDFRGLLPGTYTLSEYVPVGDEWLAIGDTSVVLTIESTLTQTVDGPVIIGSERTHNFTNLCVGLADFDTKGYWHNKNGLTELTAEDLRLANGLAPYEEASSYFAAGDEPFDGYFTGGAPVEAAHGDWGEEIAPAGSAKAEVSHFLVDSNATGDPREQLAQQLLAFFFNTLHRLDHPAVVLYIGGELVTAEHLIAGAIDAWLYGSAAERTEWARRLDVMNNSDALPVVHGEPCALPVF